MSHLARERDINHKTVRKTFSARSPKSFRIRLNMVAARARTGSHKTLSYYRATRNWSFSCYRAGENYMLQTLRRLFAIIVICVSQLNVPPPPVQPTQATGNSVAQ